MYQSNPPRPPQETLPTMYDLPSEDIEESGLPDEFHSLQSQFLRDTFLPEDYSAEEIFIGTDINLYYDSRNPLWYKRPDWFAVVGVSRLYQQREMRLSYVVWQEGVNPFMVVELLSPGTEKEDLGQSLRDAAKPPTKWEVYERILRVPYYVVFSRYTNELQVFELTGVRYQQLSFINNLIWFPELKLGLGLWEGTFQGVNAVWLRWYDLNNNWIPTPAERQEQEKQQRELTQQILEQERQQRELTQQILEQERQQRELTQQILEQEREKNRILAQKLRDLGIDPEQF